MSYLNREHRTAGPLIERKRARKSEALIYKQPRVSYDCRNGDHSKCAMATCSCQQCPCKFKSA